MTPYRLFTDSSFDWKSTGESKENVVRGKIAVSGEGIEIIEQVAIGKVPNLKQYNNILELIAIARAVELATQRGLNEGLIITTDSKIAMYWARNGKCSDKVVTKAHESALEYLKTCVSEYGRVVKFEHTNRENNPAGHMLEEELLKGKPHEEKQIQELREDKN